MVSFDLDGVIMQNPFAKGVTPQVRDHIRRGLKLKDVDPEEANRQIDEAVRETWAEHMTHQNFVAAYDWDTIYNAVSQKFEGESVASVAEMVERCCEVDGMIALLPGAEQGLLSLKTAGFELVAATNGYYAYQWPVLKALGVDGYFSRLLTPDRSGYAKPDPRFFAGPANLRAHVGDTLFHDVLGANAAQVTSVWLDSELPEEILALAVRDRTASAPFEQYFRQYWERALYRTYHREATLEACWPDAVVKDVAEAATFIVGEYA